MTALNDQLSRFLPPPDIRAQYRWMAGLGSLILLAVVIFHDGSLHLWKEWKQPEFSHGPIIPLISFYLIWRSRFRIMAADHKGQWTGIVFILVALLCLLMGELSTVYSLIEFAFIVAVIGLFYCFIGHGGMYFAAGPLIHLFLMMPVPDLIYNSLSQKLQLISSALGVFFIRLFHIPVFLEGNMIDLGLFDLQVAEACNGLRYAYPLTSIAYVIAFSFKGPIWKKLLIIAAAIPLAIFMNALRIGITGLLVDRFGIAAAEGFLHYFEGWVIFILCLIVLSGLVALLGCVFGPHKRLFDCMAIEPPLPPEDLAGRIPERPLYSRSALIAGVLLLFSVLVIQLLPDRANALPPRMPLVTMPSRLGDWAGKDQSLDPEMLRRLRLTDYKLSNYRSTARPQSPVQLYVSYYASQRKGSAVHSPGACMPAGGWEILSLTQEVIPGAGRGGRPLHVNRALISKGTQRQLVYYWFDQRGRTLTSALEVKLMIFWDALTRGRTDGAMIRLSTDLPPRQSVSAGDARLKDFARLAYPALAASLPE